MSGLVLPDWVARNEAKRRALEEKSSGLAQTSYWNPLLKEVDRRIQLVFVANSEPEPGVVPWRWHLLRTSDEGVPTYLAITTNGLGVPGDFREMDSGILESLRGGDLWNAQVRKAKDDARRRHEASVERSKETRREARVDDIALNIKAMDSPSINFGDGSWSARAKGKRGRKR